MTSEIRANTLKNRVGLGTIEYSSTGPIVSGIVTANGADINGDIDVDGHTNLDNVSIAGVTTMTGVTNLSSELRANGNIRMTNAGPKISFIDSNHDSDFHIENADGSFEIRDVTNGADRVRIASNGTISLLSNVNVSGDLDVDGHTNLDNVSIAGVSTFSGNITGASGVDLNLDSSLGSSSSTAFSGFNGRLVFDTTYSDSARGPNKIQLQHDGNWISGFGISSNTLDIYTGGTVRFSRSTNSNSYTTQLTIDNNGNLSPSGDVILNSSAGNNSSTAVTDAAWSRLEFDQDYSDTARGPNKILLTNYSNWKAGFGISSNSFDIYTGGNIHFYGKTNTNDAANKELLAKFATDGAVELYHNNSKKFETLSSGVQVTGTLAELRFNCLNGTGKQYKFSASGTNSTGIELFDITLIFTLSLVGL